MQLFPKKIKKCLSDIVEQDSYNHYEKELVDVLDTVKYIKESIRDLEEKLKAADEIDNLSTKAKYFPDKLLGIMNETRMKIDSLEEIMPNELWPLPKYIEMFF